MIKPVTFIISLFSYAVALSQGSQSDSTFTCNAYWKKGEEKVLLIKRHQQGFESGKLQPPFNFSYEAAVTVLDSSNQGYTIQWIFHLPEAVKRAELGLAELMPVYEGLKMIFTTTRAGTFKDLINWQEVRDAYVKMMEVSLPKKMNDTARAAIEKSKELFNSKEMVEAALIKEIILYHFLYGGAFTTNGSRQQTSIPSPFSADSLPATVTYKITEMETALDYVKISTDQQIDVGGAGNIIEGLFRKMNLPEDSVMVRAKELLARFEIKDNSEYIITPSSGWVKRMYYKRTTRTAEMSKEDSFLIEMK